METPALQILAALALAATSAVGHAQDTDVTAEEPPGTGLPAADHGVLRGPTSVGGELDASREDAHRFPRMAALREAMQPWYDLKAEVRERTGLDFALSYAALVQRASRSGESGERNAAAGVARFYGTWSLLDRGGVNEGAFVFRVEHRHDLGTELVPTQLAQDGGSVTASARTFSDFGLGWTIGYWRQRLLDGRAVVVAGRVDPTDWFDMYALSSSQSHFLNKAFGTHPTVDAPDVGFGAAAGAMLDDDLYAIAGVSDAIGSTSQSRWSDVRDDTELFHHAEIGWTSGREAVATDNVHVGWWRTDRREDAGLPASWGLTFSASIEDDDGFIPFVRAGYADGETTSMDRVVTLGAAQRVAVDDLLGAGLSWGRPQDRDLDDQWTAELFYRLQLADDIHLTPDVQVIADPSADPDADALWIVGLRLRITF